MNKKPHIIILIPCYKRANILRICIDGITKLIEVNKLYKITPVWLISPEDTELKAIRKLLTNQKYVIEYSNLQVGEKLNAGINFIHQTFKYDYLMNFGSDNIIHPNLLHLFKPYIEAKIHMFGLTNIYFHNYKHNETLFMALYDKLMPYGLARMIHYDVINHFKNKHIDLYCDRLNSGLDTNSFHTMQNIEGFQYIKIDTGNIPLTIDIKSNTNINHWLVVSKVNAPEKYNVDLKTISEYFYNIIYKTKR